MGLISTARHYHLREIGSYKNLEIGEIKVEPPKSNEVLVKVHAVSLQYRDLAIASGIYPVNGPDKLIPCSDMAGEIVGVGDDVEGWKQGDRVCANFATDHIHGDTNPAIQRTSLGGQSHGVLTEYRPFPAHSILAIPEHLSYEEGSTLPCAALTAYNALHGPVPVKAGDYVLVLGTGGVSIFALQFAIASGAIVIATSSSDEKLQVATKLGAKHVINYNKTPNWDEEVIIITKGTGVDHVIEVGGQGTLSRTINAVRTGGSVHIIGFVSRESSSFNFVQWTIMKAILFRGIQIGSVAQFIDMNRLIIANPDKTKPVIDRVFQFEEAQQAYAYLESQAHIGKVVIRVSKQ